MLNFPAFVSHIIHCIIAGGLFGSFAYMIGWRFTKTDSTVALTEGKKKRNLVYRICAAIIICAMALQVGTSVCGISWFTIINETIMLWAFSFAWAVKADMIKQFND